MEKFYFHAPYLIIVYLIISSPSTASSLYTFELKDNERSSTLKITSIDSKKHKIEIFAQNGYNTGTLEGYGFLNTNTISMIPQNYPECSIYITIHGKEAKVRQDGGDGQCGLGMGVTVGGNYIYTSTEHGKQTVDSTTNKDHNSHESAFDLRDRKHSEPNTRQNNSNTSQQPQRDKPNNAPPQHEQLDKLTEEDLERSAKKISLDIISTCADKIHLLQTVSALHELATNIYFAAKSKNLKSAQQWNQLLAFILHYKGYITCLHDQYQCTKSNKFNEFADLLTFDGSMLLKILEARINFHVDANELENANFFKYYIKYSDLINNNFSSNPNRPSSMCKQ